MRLLRSVLVTALTAAAVTVGTAGSASAAPPVGCYGFPSIPDAFVCVTSFTPTNAVPSVGLGGGTSVTIPEFCAGDCYGPITVPVPGPDVTFGGGQIAVITYDGGTYAIVVGQVPSVPPLGGGDGCPGTPYLGVDLGPFVCTGLDYGYYSDGYGYYWVFGTCVVAPCVLLPVSLDDVNQLYAEIWDILPV